MAIRSKQKQRTLTRVDAELVMTRAKKGQYRDALLALSEARGDELSPHDVVREARDRKSPLHSAFEWDDTAAGEKYRLIQARILINNVTVEFQGEKRQAFFNANVTINKQQTRAYFPVERVMSDEVVHQAVLADAVRDLEHAQQKYDQISELKGVINTKVLSRAKKKIRRN